MDGPPMMMPSNAYAVAPPKSRTAQLTGAIWQRRYCILVASIAGIAGAYLYNKVIRKVSADINRQAAEITLKQVQSRQAARVAATLAQRKKKSQR